MPRGPGTELEGMQPFDAGMLSRDDSAHTFQLGGLHYAGVGVPKYGEEVVGEQLMQRVAGPRGPNVTRASGCAGEAAQSISPLSRQTRFGYGSQPLPAPA